MCLIQYKGTLNWWLWHLVLHNPSMICPCLALSLVYNINNKQTITNCTSCVYLWSHSYVVSEWWRVQIIYLHWINHIYHVIYIKAHTPIGWCHRLQPIININVIISRIVHCSRRRVSYHITRHCCIFSFLCTLLCLTERQK